MQIGRFPGQESLWNKYGQLKQYYVYIVSNNSMTLYTGVTNDLVRRVFEHKQKLGSRFTAKYHFDRLVWFEVFDVIIDAISREKAVKNMSRAKKIAMIKRENPSWRDLMDEP